MAPLEDDFVRGSGGTHRVVEPATGETRRGAERSSGRSRRCAGAKADIEAFTETQWVAVRADSAAYPF
jgi:hypothetical protein